MTNKEFTRLFHAHINLTHYLNIAQKQRDLGLSVFLSNEGHIIAIQLQDGIEQAIYNAGPEAVDAAMNRKLDDWSSFNFNTWLFKDH